MSWVERMKRRTQERRFRADEVDREARRVKEEQERVRRKEDVDRYYRDQMIMKRIEAEKKVKEEEEERRRLQVQQELDETLRQKALERSQQTHDDDNPADA